MSIAKNAWCVGCLLAVLLLVVGCSPTTVSDSVQVVASGKLSSHGVAQSGVEVVAYPAESQSLGGQAPYRAARSAPDGSFILNVPIGEYYFLAAGNGLFSYYGRNPVMVGENGVGDLKMALVPIPPVEAPQVLSIDNGIAGTVLVDGKPLPGVVVYAYTDLTSRLKGMGYAMSVPTDTDGRFELSLPAGTYYLLARLRQGGGMVMGPMRAGDFVGYAPANPIRVMEGQVAMVSIPLLEVPEKTEQLGDSLFGQTVIKGRILDKSGQPVADARALLYDDAQMLNRPRYVSRPSAADGSYALSVPSGGTYYLAARQQLGGAPAPGELYGTWDGSLDHSLTLVTGEQRTGIDLIVEAMW